MVVALEYGNSRCLTMSAIIFTNVPFGNNFLLLYFTIYAYFSVISFFAAITHISWTRILSFVYSFILPPFSRGTMRFCMVDILSRHGTCTVSKLLFLSSRLHRTQPLHYNIAWQPRTWLTVVIYYIMYKSMRSLPTNFLACT